MKRLLSAPRDPATVCARGLAVWGEEDSIVAVETESAERWRVRVGHRSRAMPAATHAVVVAGGRRAHALSLEAGGRLWSSEEAPFDFEERPGPGSFTPFAIVEDRVVAASAAGIDLLALADGARRGARLAGFNGLAYPGGPTAASQGP